MTSEKCSLISKKQTKKCYEILPQKEEGCCVMGVKVWELFLCWAAEDACGVTQRAGRGCSLSCHPCDVYMCSNK